MFIQRVQSKDLIFSYIFLRISSAVCLPLALASRPSRKKNSRIRMFRVRSSPAFLSSFFWKIQFLRVGRGSKETSEFGSGEGLALK